MNAARRKVFIPSSTSNDKVYSAEIELEENPVEDGNATATAKKDLEECTSSSKPAQTRRLTLITLMAITYFLVAGGPYGLENMVGTLGSPFYVIILFILFPIVYALPLSLVCAELATSIPDNGGVMSWIKEAFGHFLGFEVGFCVSTTYMLDISLYPVMFLAYLNEALGFELNPWIRWGIGCGLIVTLTIINIVGLEIVGALSIVFIIAVTSPFFVLPILGFKYLDPTVIFESAKSFPVNADWGYFLTLLIWNNSGWISPGFLAGETKRPQQTYPRAMILTMIFANITYVIPVIIGVCINRDWSQWEIGYFARVGKEAGGTWLMMWIIVASMCTNAGLFNAALSTSSRSIASMADSSYYPKFLGYKTPKVKTPIVAILLDCVVTCLLIGLPFEYLIGAQTCINSMTMVLLYASFIYLRAKKPAMERPFKVPLNNILAGLMCLIPVCISIWNVIRAEYTSQIAAAVAIALATIIYPIRFWNQFKGMVITAKQKLVSLFSRKITKSTETLPHKPISADSTEPDMSSATTSEESAVTSFAHSGSDTSVSPPNDNSPKPIPVLRDNS